MEQFSCKTKIISGPGALAALGKLGAKRVFVVTDPYFYGNGTAQKVAELFGAEEYALFHQVEPDPGLDLAAIGTAQLRDFGADWVCALGGGSAMDCAKAMVFFSGSDARLAAIPTTSGSGSEVTDFAILTHNGVKHPLVDSRIRPNVAILDSDLLQSLPKGLIADAGFDVLCHAAESYVATGAGGITDALARDAFCTVYSALEASWNGDTGVRQEIHVAATMAGMAFTQSGLGLCHAMSHSLGGAFHVPHGRLNAILLPAVMAVNTPAQDKYARLARAAGIGGGARSVETRNLRNGLIRLRTVLGLPGSLAQAGVDLRQLRRMRGELIQTVLADPCCQTNPREVDAGLVEQVLEEVAGGG